MQPQNEHLTFRAALIWALAAVLSFHAAYEIPHAQLLLILFFYSLFTLARLPTTRLAFYFGIGIAFGIYAIQTRFFWAIFQIAAIPLWIILSFWVGLFLGLGQRCRARLGPLAWTCLAPFLWVGFEYFRSELYYLRFTWVNAGFAFSTSPLLGLAAHYGVYGVGFIFMALAAWLGGYRFLNIRQRAILGFALVILVAAPLLASSSIRPGGKRFRATGVQMEFPSLAEVLSALDKSLEQDPGTDLFVLSEYTFTGTIPKPILKWCKTHQKYLAVGGEDPVRGIQYYNTIFVIDTNGAIVFRQAKSVPIQFFKDGLPAVRQTLWNSPWGKIGFAICYDASFSRVIDQLVRLGAQVLIFPTMDVEDWGAHQHRMHARVAPMRAAEYGLPVFRLCSSGISQAVNATGKVEATAPFPGSGAILTAEIQPATIGHLPPDRTVALTGVAITAFVIAWLTVDSWKKRRKIPSIQT